MNLRCLIVDDSERFVRSARRLLEREGATVVATATTGAEAIAAAATLEVDVSLVDVQLGGESGARVADALARAAWAGGSCSSPPAAPTTWPTCWPDPPRSASCQVGPLAGRDHGALACR